MEIVPLRHLRCGLARCAAFATLLLLAPPALAAQDEALVGTLAPLLAAEDARRWEPAVLQRALSAPDARVRRAGALAAGRIGDLRAVPLLLPLLTDTDSTVQPVAAFALGLLRDTAAVEPLIRHLSVAPALPDPAVHEAFTALARIGGSRAAEYMVAVLERRAPLVVPDTTTALAAILGEMWRMGDAAPAAAALPYARDETIAVRRAAIYSLGRLGTPGASDAIVVALRDRDDLIQAWAARALTQQYAERAGLAAGSAPSLLVPLLQDPSPDVRISALRSLGTFGDSALAGDAGLRVDDAHPHVQLQAIATLGALGGSAAAAPLLRVLDADRAEPLQRAALETLARVDSAAFFERAAEWRGRADWRARAAVAAGYAAAGRPGALLDDSDPRVVLAALNAWSAGVEREESDPALTAAALQLLAHDDPAVRSVAADALARAADPSHIDALLAARRRALRDSAPDSEIAALGALAAIASGSEGGRARIETAVLAGAAPDRYVVRQWAETNWPAAAARWGSPYPVTTGRTLQDYREVARRFIVDTATNRPRVTIEIEQRGTLEVELLGPDAPLTVANFMALVDRRFFDGIVWHRVVPGFVVQTGDPRGDGWGGGLAPIRDEINRHTYVKPMLGMALSGPDTGTSQWFINLSPQPHLDATYTIFGRIPGSAAPLGRILPGDVIRTVRR